jgi:hypothetical protein
MIITSAAASYLDYLISNLVMIPDTKRLLAACHKLCFTNIYLEAEYIENIGAEFLAL